jgi:hypothetical protein
MIPENRRKVLIYLGFGAVQQTLNKTEDNSTRNIIKAIYLSNTNKSCMNEFKELGTHMIQEMKLLQRIIRKIMSLDKNYAF